MVEIPESLVAECCAPWRLRLVCVLPADFSYVAAVERADGTPAVLKIAFHRGNVLAARREPWLAVDPKASVAEREFDAAWLLGDRVTNARRRLDFLAAELDLDRERLRAWAVARYALGGLWDYESGGDGSALIAAAAAVRAT